MDLRERLRLLKAAGAARASAPAEPSGPVPLPFGPAPDQERSPRAALLGGGIAGYVTATANGETFYCETRYPVEYCRGPLPLAHVAGVPSQAWERLGRVSPGFDPRRAVYFDTETTGLAGGTGTYAFLAGLGFFEGHDFIVRQYFLRDYAEEEAMLTALAADLARFGTLVSFNGKSFDWPLLETRYRMQRRRPPLQGFPHLDLLHPARRLWRERLGACNLTHLEACILGVHRQGDVPGHLIPQLYFDYLRTGEAAPLADVVLHNRLDILSLVSLAGWMGQMVSDPTGPTPDGELLCGDDLYALGRLFEARGLLGEGLACYEAARERGVSSVTELRALRSLSQVYKRMKAHDRALKIWESLADGQETLSLYPYVEMAKHYEHVAKEYAIARQMAERALEIADRRRRMAGSYGPGAARDWQACKHRLERLDRKLNA